MNDFDYPQSTTGKWYGLKPLDSPFPEQLATLKLVRDGLNGDAYFIDTIYGFSMTAMILFQSQPQFASLGKSEDDQDEQIKSLHAFQQQNPDAWHSALEAITQSTINHIRHIKDIGASGALVSIFNAESKFGSVADDQQYTRPMTGVSSTRLPTQISLSSISPIPLEAVPRSVQRFQCPRHSILCENERNPDPRGSQAIFSTNCRRS